MARRTFVYIVTIEYAYEGAAVIGVAMTPKSAKQLFAEERPDEKPNWKRLKGQDVVWAARLDYISVVAITKAPLYDGGN